jgi:hypothetical protein
VREGVRRTAGVVVLLKMSYQVRNRLRRLMLLEGLRS